MFYNYISDKKSRGKVYQGCDSSIEIAQNIPLILCLKRDGLVFFIHGSDIIAEHAYIKMPLGRNRRYEL